MHQMSFGGRAPPGPAGGAYNDPPDSDALKLLAPWALDARRLTSPSRPSVLVLLFFAFEHWGGKKTTRLFYSILLARFTVHRLVEFRLMISVCEAHQWSRMQNLRRPVGQNCSSNFKP